MPSVSVIMAVYNGEKYLSEALDSILAQTYQKIEIIVVDDGSSDRTREIAQSYGTQVRYAFQVNQGQPSAQNHGISLARSSYISFLDADDLFEAEKSHLQVAFLESHPEIDFVLGYLEQFISPDISLENPKKWFCPPGMSPGYLAIAGLFRKECFEKVGLFNEKQQIGLFIDWYMRAEEKGLKNSLIPQKVCRRRIHENNMTIHAQNSRLEYIQIVKQAFHRRKLSGSFGYS